jgi:hypothetical protein
MSDGQPKDIYGRTPEQMGIGIGGNHLGPVPQPASQPTSNQPAFGGWRNLISTVQRSLEEQREARNAADSFEDDDFYGPGGGRLPSPVTLPRLEGPNDLALAAQLFTAVNAARAPYQAARATLDQSRRTGEKSINTAGVDATRAVSANNQAWRTASAGLDQRIGDAYNQALQQLSGNIGAKYRQSPAAIQAMSMLAGLGANAQEYGARRLQQGEASAAGMLNNVSNITQAGKGTLASTYAAVLGQITQQQSAAETAARAQHEAEKQALIQQIAQINHQTAVQEAMANSGR